MRILIESNFVSYFKKLQAYVSELISDANYKEITGIERVIIISSKPISLNHLSHNKIVDSNIITEILDIPNTISNIELYIVPDTLCRLRYREEYRRNFDYYVLSRLYNQPSIIENINFDISIISIECKKSVKTKNSIDCTFSRHDNELSKYTISVNDKYISCESNFDVIYNICNEEFKKLVQLIDSEPIIEAKPLEVQIAELREELAKSTQMTEQATKIVSLEVQIAELHEMISAYFPIREMEKLKLEVLETEKLKARNTELELEMGKLKKMITGIHEVSKIE
jgi:hypothetical protein